MVELGLVDYFVMGEAVGIVATLFVSFFIHEANAKAFS